MRVMARRLEWLLSIAFWRMYREGLRVIGMFRSVVGNDGCVS